MKKTNLFIIGAPKCGTTSLANYLAEHCEVYISRIKEPHFFNFDLQNRYINTELEYEKLFQNSSCKYRLDASVWYYYSKVAVKEIVRYNRESKFIFMARNPVSLFYSLHQELLNTYEESKRSPEEAWELSKSREAGKNIPPLTKEKSLLYYHKTCALGDRFEELLSHVKRENIIIIDFKKFTEDTHGIFQNLCNWLDIEPISVPYQIYNAKKNPKSMFIAKGVKFLGILKKRMGIREGFGLLNRVKFGNLAQVKAEPSHKSPDLDKKIKEYFREDINKLTRLSGYDFAGSWEY